MHPACKHKYNCFISTAVEFRHLIWKLQSFAVHLKWHYATKCHYHHPSWPTDEQWEWMYCYDAEFLWSLSDTLKRKNGALQNLPPYCLFCITKACAGGGWVTNALCHNKMCFFRLWSDFRCYVTTAHTHRESRVIHFLHLWRWRSCL